MTINEVFLKFLMKKFSLTFDQALAIYREYLDFRLSMKVKSPKKVEGSK